MPTYPLVKFMSGPAAAATVRYDFNAPITSGRKHVLHTDWDIGFPQLEGEPDDVAVEYGNRTVSFTQRVEGTRANAMVALSALARELQRTDNWLYFRIASDRDPVWFHTFRPTETGISFENVDMDDGPDAWDITVTMEAEPFAYGERVALSNITIDNNPSSGSNPIVATLPAITGDAPAPLRIQVNPTNSTETDGYRFMLSMHSGESAPSVPIVWQIGASDGWTAGTDTGASVANAAYSGGSYRACTFATNTMITRLSGVAPASLPMGTYKVLLRVARSDTSSTFAVRFGQSVSFSYFYNDTVVMDRAASTASGHATYLDLGQMTHPRNYANPADNPGAAYAPDVAIQAQRLSGSGSLHFDAIVLIPIKVAGTVETRTIFAEFPVNGISTGAGFGVFDGELEALWGITSVAGATGYKDLETTGQFPRAIPGAVNILHLLQQVNGAKPFFGQDTSDDITVDTVVTISYHPRWLWIGDG